MITLNNTDSLSYISSGLFKSSGEWIHPRRIIDTYEILIMYEGIAFICEENHEFELHKNDILFLEPGKEHYGYKSSCDFVSFAWIHFKADGNRFKTLPKIVHTDDTFSLRTLVSQLLHTTNTPNYNSTMSDMFCALIAEEILFQNKSDEIPGKLLAVQIKEWIRTNINKNITVRQIAQHFGYHENHINRIFKNSYNICIKKYITDYKIKITKDMLCTTLYTIKQIAYICGFESENHFIKFFKYHTKITPTECRNTYINTHINNS